jgi:high-affinity iron transporter
MDLSLAIPVFLVTLREGVEAALVIGIVLACLTKANATHLAPVVYRAIVVGLLASLALGGGLGASLHALGTASWPYAPALQQVIQAGTAAIAVGLLSWMLIWMTTQAKGLKQEVEASVTMALQRNTDWGIFSLIFVAVLREGVETALFVGAQLQDGWMPALGAIAGLGGATLIGLGIFQGGLRLDLRLFFRVMGTMLLLIVGGLLITALRKLDAGLTLLNPLQPFAPTLCPFEPISCVLGPTAWDLSTILPDRQFPGILLKTLFGYTQHLYWGQAITYLVFWLSVGRLYWQRF